MSASRTPPDFAIVVPCFNEEEALPDTAAALAQTCEDLRAAGLIGRGRVIFVDDGSTDDTWDIIAALSKNAPFGGIRLSGNRGHQNALLCGLMTIRAEATISIDADLQDDTAAMAEMLRAYAQGADIVYGVRARRDSDTWFKRISAGLFYRLLRALGAKTIPQHADYRLMSARAVEALRGFGEVNLYLRGIVPLLGFKTRIVAYDRKAREKGTSKYPLTKMLALALEGVTSFSVRPLRWITVAGIMLSSLSFLAGLWAVGVRLFGGDFVPGWASTVIPLYFLGGLQMLSLGVVGEYLGKVYLETKRRPRFIVAETVGSLEATAS